MNANFFSYRQVSESMSGVGVRRHAFCMCTHYLINHLQSFLEKVTKFMNQTKYKEKDGVQLKKKPVRKKRAIMATEEDLYLPYFPEIKFDELEANAQAQKVDMEPSSKHLWQK